MDKLEKAMEKARRQREGYTNNNVTALHASGLGSSGTYLAQRNTHTSISEPFPLTAAQLEQNRILAHHSKSTEADAFRMLRTQVLQIMAKSDLKTLAITSPRYGDGKTTIALNLAISIALDIKQTVLLVDLDLRKPSLNQYLGLQNKNGLIEHLIDNVPVSECLVRMPFDRLSILPAGQALDHSSEVLGSPKMAAFAHELKIRYHDRLVIYDMPPVLAQDDTIAFLPHVDATLLVVRDGVTKANDLKMCLERLANTNIIGTVLNNAF